MLLALARVWQGAGEELAVLGEHWPHGAKLPLRIVLRRFAEQLPAGNAPTRAGDLWDFVGRELAASGLMLGAHGIAYLQQIAATHGALVVFDGLDECGDLARRTRVQSAVQEFIHNSPQQSRFVLTARPYALPDGPDARRGVYLLGDFSDEQVQLFIERWYAAMIKRGWTSVAVGETRAAQLLAARSRQDLRLLAQNPLLLTLIASLHVNGGELPDDRAELYERSVELLMQHWNAEIGADQALLTALNQPGLTLGDLRDVLEALAFEVHAENVGQHGVADIGEARLERAFRRLFDDDRNKAHTVVEYIEKRAGLLLALGERNGEAQFTFPHRTFQEFLAACHLAKRENVGSDCRELAQQAAAHWAVVLVLAARKAGPERGVLVADALVGSLDLGTLRRRPDTTAWTRALLAGMQLCELSHGSRIRSEQARNITARVAEWLVGLLPIHPHEGGLSARDRAVAGDLLDKLGDPRFDPGRFHLPGATSWGFVAVAADAEFRIGTHPAHRERISSVLEWAVDDNEVNDAVTPTAAFQIARYAVTVAQFRAFVEHRQAQDEDFRLGDKDALRDAGTRPVRRVSWHEAREYCVWLQARLVERADELDPEYARLLLEQGWQVDLPSELEWEKAARGLQRDAIFTWGDTPDAECANYADTEIGTTSTVGCFPASDLGLHDMLGNVWEWTRSPWSDSYGAATPVSASDGANTYSDGDDEEDEDSRVVARGGSWASRRANARVAYRLVNRPDNRFDFLGFRVVLRRPPVS